MARMKDSANLDSLRTLAIALVVFSHLGLMLGWSSPAWEMVVLGRIGVAVFFVHTSLVLMWSLDRHAGSATPFLIRRFFRIYPLAMFIVALTAAGNWLGGVPLDRWTLISNLALVQNIPDLSSNPGPLWSLPYEVQMYLALPAIHAFIRPASTLVRAALLLAGSIALLSIAQAVGIDFRLVRFLPCFLAGVLAYAMSGHQSRTLHPATLLAIVAAAAAVAPALVAAGASETLVMWVVCLVLGVSIPRCREVDTGWVGRWAKTGATYSYSVYLTHLFAISAGFGIAAWMPAPLRWAGFVMMLVAWPRIAYRYVEAPGIKLGAAVIRRFFPAGERLDRPSAQPAQSQT